MTTTTPNAPTALERPLVLDGESVRALLDGRKTQHRVPVARLNSYVDGHRPSLPLWEALDLSRAWVDGGPSPAGNPGPYLKAPTFDGDSTHRVYSRVQVGDQLWVREEWAAFLLCGLRTKYYRTGVMKHEPLGNTAGRVVEVVYRADGEDVTQAHPNNATAGWSRARRMPRWAARLTLEVADLRVQRVQELSEADAIAEGMAREWRGAPCSAVAAFRESWDRHHYARGLGWDANPFVWCFTFNRVCT